MLIRYRHCMFKVRSSLLLGFFIMVLKNNILCHSVKVLLPNLPNVMDSRAAVARSKNSRMSEVVQGKLCNLIHFVFSKSSVSCEKEFFIK